jgi:hypothetical protein
LRFVAGPTVAEDDVDAPRGKLAGHDDADPFSAGDQRNFVPELHYDKCNHENTKTRRKSFSFVFLCFRGVLL